MNPELKIDPEFESMCPPLTDEEYQQLEENILSEGIVLMPLIIWDGTIIDGHNRYKIAQAHPRIVYNTYEKQFESRFAAIAWICRNQLGRRNLTPQQKKYLIGQRYEAEKVAESFHGNQHTSARKSGGGQNDPRQTNSYRTRDRIADETHTSGSYVKRAGNYAKGVDAAEEAIPGIKGELLSGSIKPADKDVAAIARASHEERRQKAEALRVKPNNGMGKAKSSSSKSKPTMAKRQELQEIRDIYTDMLPDEASAPTSEDSILETLHGAVTDMIRICDTLFADFPRLLEDHTYRARVIEIMQKPKNYILQIEGVRQ